MRTPTPSTIRVVVCSCFLLLSALGARGQGAFQNLGFENTSLLVFVVNPFGPVYGTNATIPGWDWSPHANSGYTDPNTTVSFNNVALSTAAVTLHNRRSRYAPAVLGNYSVLLQGGYGFYGFTGASIFQTGLVSVATRSLLFAGGSSIQVSFNGQSLTRVALSNAANYTLWGADISAYAGQSGELRFTAPLGTESILDDIQFSPTPVPEPSALMLFGLCIVCLLVFFQRPSYASRGNGCGPGTVGPRVTVALPTGSDRWLPRR